MATIKDDKDYALCLCGAVKLNRFQCFNGCGVVNYPDFSLPPSYVERYIDNFRALRQLMLDVSGLR
jgi:hypothetical protein